MAFMNDEYTLKQARNGSKQRARMTEEEVPTIAGSV
jgi:hypothetical protein